MQSSIHFTRRSNVPNPPTAESLDARIAAAVQTVRQPRPKQVRPIIVIGAGGIVRAAHLPAYEKVGFPVIGLMDQDGDKAAALAAERRIPHAFGSVAEAVRFAPRDAIFDVAVSPPPPFHTPPHLTHNAAPIPPKPPGESPPETPNIFELLRRNGFTAPAKF